jgi:hypothetical protein
VRIALVDFAARPAARELCAGLRHHGHDADIVELDPGSHGGGWVAATARLADLALARRGFATPLAGVPLTVARMRRRHYDLAHVLSIPGVPAALAWRRLTGRPIVFTAVEPVTRAILADRRLRLRLVREAFEGSDAVTAADPAARATALRWLALDLPLVELADAEGYLRLYRTVLSRR